MRNFLLLVLAVLPLSANAKVLGITGYSNKVGINCTACHTAGAAVPTVALSGPATLVAGATGSYSLKITGGPGVVAGMDAALSGVNSGAAVFTAGAGSKVANGEVIHSAAMPFTAGAATFTFTIKAPLTGGVFTVSAAGVSANNNVMDVGDSVGTTSLDVTVTLTAPPAADAGTGPVVTPAADAGAAGPPPPVGAPPPAARPDGGTPPLTHSAPGSKLSSTGGGNLSDGLVEGEGCSATGSGSSATVAALMLLALVGRRVRLKRPLISKFFSPR